MARCAALLVAAPASGQGKTTVSAGLARLHARNGKRVRAFKCGPDFLDPNWLELATGGPAYQLDLWMTGEHDCRARLHAAATEADLVIVEGVMGLYDGAPSAADLARHFGLPVLAVIDAGAMAGTFGAVAHGLRHYADDLPWAGVVANKVAGDVHAQMLRASLRDPAEWLAALPRNADIGLPERALGLVRADELPDAMARLDAAADALARTPLAAFSNAVRFDPPPPAPPVPQLLAGRTVAVARDAAFCFAYTANLDLLQALGARVVFFSPLADSALPPCDAVWLTGGYPELHAEAIARNHAMQGSLARHVDAGQPVWAECGGMMALFDELVTADAKVHRAWGLLPGRVTMNARPSAIGPQRLVWEGHELRGHTFHYSSCTSPLAPVARTQSPLKPDAPGEPVFQRGALRASYLHAWFPSSPQAVARLFSRV